MSASIDPIDYGIRPEDNRLGHRAAVGLTVLFLLVISLPGLLREFSPDAIRGALARIGHWHDGTVVDRLRAAEKRVDDGAWTKPVRQQVQTVLYEVFREGNRKVLVGRDGWLFHRPGIRALTGRGPVLGPTYSVAKDHTLKDWEGPIPVIQAFAAQLKERGIQLVLVPVPDKAAGVLPEAMTPHVYAVFSTALDKLSPLLERVAAQPGGERPAFVLWRVINNTRSSLQPSDAVVANQFISHPDFLFHSLPVASIQPSVPHVVSSSEPSRLRGDTHPRPWFLRELARKVAGSIPLGAFASLQAASPASMPLQEVSARDSGDLVNSLSIAGVVPAEDIASYATTPATSDPTSPIVLLGDSNVNMYDDPNLPFYMPGAGFGSWLSAYLGRSLHIIAINGGGATAVREQFAALPDDVVRAKKVVVWVIAERDLFMDPAVARENGVEWKRVKFNPNRSQPTDAVPGEAIVVDVTLKAKSALQNLAQANYPDAVYVAECTVDKVVTGTYASPELAVVLWNFRNRQVQPSAGYAPGQKLRLTLVPWDSKGDLTKTNRSDDFLRFDLPLLYAEKTEPR